MTDETPTPNDNDVPKKFVTVVRSRQLLAGIAATEGVGLDIAKGVAFLDQILLETGDGAGTPIAASSSM